LALAGSAPSSVNHHLNNNHVRLWLTVNDCYPLVLATAYEKEHNLDTPVELLIIEANCEMQIINSPRSF